VPGTVRKSKLKSGKVSWGFVLDRGKKENGARDQVAKYGFRARGEAAQALADAISNARQPKSEAPSDVPFGIFFLQWLADHGASNWSPKTIEANRQRAEYACRTIGTVPLSQLTPQILEQCFNGLKARGGKNASPVSGKTVKEVTSLVNQALKKATKWGLLQCNPMEDVDRITAPPTEARAPSIREYTELL
jgi:Arm DNA-binding domain